MFDFENKIRDQIERSYLPLSQQVGVIRYLILGVLILSILGCLVTLLVSGDVVMKQMFSLMSLSLVAVCCFSLALLKFGRIIFSVILMSISLYASIIIVVIPKGISENSVIMVSFIIPLILLSYIWGRFGALFALFLTMLSYAILLILEVNGVTGWSPQEKVLWVDIGFQLLIFAIVTVVIVQSQKALTSANKKLVLANQSLYETQQQLQKFTAGIVHDLGTPIQVLYRAQFIDDAQRRIAQEQLDLMGSFIQHAREYLQFQDGTIILRQEQVPIISVSVQAMTAFSTAQTMYRRISIDIDCEESLENVYVLGDAIAVRRIIDNLLRNAIGFAEPGSIVTIRIRKIDSYIEVAVVDRGPGIPYEDQEHIFEPYWSSRHNGTGWGLGLAIVRELTTAMGGEYGVISVPRSELSVSGSTFWVRLKQWQQS